MRHTTPIGMTALTDSDDARLSTSPRKRLAQGVPRALVDIVAPPYNTVEGALAECDITPDQVDDISCDHLHTHDLSKWLGGGPQPACFPKARLLVHRQEWALAQALLPVQADGCCPSPALVHPDHPNCATSSERTPFWLFPGAVDSHLFGEAAFGLPQGVNNRVPAHA